MWFLYGLVIGVAVAVIFIYMVVRPLEDKVAIRDGMIVLDKKIYAIKKLQ